MKSFEDGDKIKTDNRDDLIFEKLKNNDIKLTATDVRKRQQSCTIRDVKKDDVWPYIVLSLSIFLF